jgi:hypothetical protein
VLGSLVFSPSGSSRKALIFLRDRLDNLPTSSFEPALYFGLAKYGLKLRIRLRKCLGITSAFGFAVLYSLTTSGALAAKKSGTERIEGILLACSPINFENLSAFFILNLGLSNNYSSNANVQEKIIFYNTGTC